jgi:hypothetical protein
MQAGVSGLEAFKRKRPQNVECVQRFPALGEKTSLFTAESFRMARKSTGLKPCSGGLIKCSRSQRIPDGKFTSEPVLVLQT